MTETTKTTNKGEPNHVSVLLCTYNGEAFIEQQLDSIQNQTHQHISVYASDDGSTDETLNILKKYQAQWHKGDFKIYDGPRKGFMANFLSLVCSTQIPDSYYTFADQDDIWALDKLSHALTLLQAETQQDPVVYCSRTELIDADGVNIGYSPIFTRKPSFANALVQSIGGGNTMVLNPTAVRLMREASIGQTIISHDWWAYLVVTGAGGKILYDKKPTTLYRQHGGNLVGTNIGLPAKLLRAKQLLNGHFYEWNNVNIKALQSVKQLLTKENTEIFETFCEARQKSLFPRLAGIRKAGVYRQSTMDNTGLFVATVLNRL